MGKTLRGGICVLVAFATGCATTPPPPPLEIRPWLAQEPRALVIEVDPVYPPPTRSVLTRDERTGDKWKKATWEGTKGAVGTTLGGCGVGAQITGGGGGSALGFIVALAFVAAGCVVGLAISPVAFLVKANQGAESIQGRDVIEQVPQKGAAPLVRAEGNPMDLPRLFGEAIEAQGRAAGRHALGPVRTGKYTAHPGKEQVLRLAITRIEVEGNPAVDTVSWKVMAAASIVVPGAEPETVEWGTYTYTYTGTELRPLAEWALDDGRLLRLEIAQAARQIAAELVKDLQ